MKKLMTKLICSVMATFLLVGCSNKSVSKKEETGNKQNSVVTDMFTYAIAGDPGNTINFTTTDDRFGLMTCNAVASQLYSLNQDGSIEPILADSMEPSEDGLVYTLKMKSDLKWSDGEPLTADDVIFTYDAYNKQSNKLFVDGQPIKIEKVDDSTVTFTMPKVSASVKELLSAEVFMIPKHIFEGKESFDMNILSDEVVGSGPYILEEYKTGQYLKFKKNPYYVGGEANIGTVIYKIIENNDTAVLALQNGEADAWVGLPTDLEPFNGNEDFTITNYSEGRVAYLRINRVADSMQDTSYRKGLLLALNRDEILNASYLSSEYYVKGYSFLPTVNNYYTDSVEKYEQDVEKSKELVSNGTKSLKICYIGTDSAQEKQALAIQSELKNIGIELELNGVEQAAYMDAAYDPENKDYDMYLGGYIMGIDPDSFAGLVDSASDNLLNFNNTEINELLVKGKVELDPDKRKDIYNEVQKLVSEEALFYPLGTNLRSLLTNNRVNGMESAGLVPIYTFKDLSKLQLK